MKYALFIILFFFLAACGGDGSGGSEVVLPSNLQAEILISDNGSGDVTVDASADDVNFFTVHFGEDDNDDAIKTSTGQANFRYSASGEYVIRVRAHVTNNQFIEKTFDVIIDLANNDGVVIPTTGYESPETYDGMTLVWEDDFDGSTLNSAYWTPEIGTGTNGWGNNELQYYRSENTQVRDGHLIITAKKEAFGGSQYTSSRLITKDKKSFQYGRVDIRAVLPKGQGIWPALWMLGNSISSVGWPACGEIDIMEMIGGAGREKTVHGTLHWENNGVRECTCGEAGYSLASGTFNDEFHVFSIVWTTNSVKFYVDNVMFREVSTTPAYMSEFDASFFFIFNIAVGGNWPGSPDGTTVFPQHMIVDYIRVFQ
jgi:beta-glucanase (GH16 family)